MAMPYWRATPSPPTTWRRPSSAPASARTSTPRRWCRGVTVRNCPIYELRTTLTAMNAGWQRLKDRKEFAPVLGWVRTTEVTRGADDSAHPHFHALLMVPPSWFTGRQYVKQSRWIELWADCMRLDYAPVVDVRAVKARAPEAAQTATEAMGQALQRAVAETLKYSVKPSDMTDDPEWFLELTRQTHKCRFVATGGVLKDVLKVDQESEEDLLLQDGSSEGEDDGSRLAFGWRSAERRYRRAPGGDNGPTRTDPD